MTVSNLSLVSLQWWGDCVVAVVAVVGVTVSSNGGRGPRRMTEAAKCEPSSEQSSRNWGPLRESATDEKCRVGFFSTCL